MKVFAMSKFKKDEQVQGGSVWTETMCIAPTPTPKPTGACCTGESNEICTPNVILCGCDGIFFDDISCEPNPCVSPTPDPGDGGPLVIVPTMTGWGMIFVTIILGVLAVIGLRRKASQDT